MRAMPDWAIQVRTKMLINGISSRKVARRIGKSPAWVSDIMSGRYTCESMKTAICECVDKMVEERSREAS